MADCLQYIIHYQLWPTSKHRKDGNATLLSDFEIMRFLICGSEHLGVLPRTALLFSVPEHYLPTFWSFLPVWRPLRANMKNHSLISMKNMCAVWLFLISAIWRSGPSELLCLVLWPHPAVPRRERPLSNVFWQFWAFFREEWGKIYHFFEKKQKTKLYFIQNF